MFSLTNCVRLLEEPEWRGLGVCMSPGWRHYEIHRPEPHILLFRRRLTCDESKLGAAHAVDKDPDVGAIVPAKAGDDPMPAELEATAIDKDPNVDSIAPVKSGDDPMPVELEAPTVDTGPDVDSIVPVKPGDDPVPIEFEANATDKDPDVDSIVPVKLGNDPVPIELEATAAICVGSIVQAKRPQLRNAMYPYECPNCNLAIASYTFLPHFNSPSSYTPTCLPYTPLHISPYPFYPTFK